MEPDSVPDVVAETQVSTEDPVSESSVSSAKLKVESVDQTAASTSSQSLPVIQRVVAVPPSVGASVDVWPNQGASLPAPPDVVIADISPAYEANEIPNHSDQSADAKQYCCLLDSGKRCHRVAGNASFSRKINKMASQKGLKLNTDIHCKHIYICDHHKNLIQRVRPAKVVRRQQQPSDDENTNDSFAPKRSGSATGNVDVSPADMATNKQLIEHIVRSMSLQVLRRYRQAHKLPGKAGNKNQLQELVASHFDSVPVNESDVVHRFFRVLRTNSNKLDQQLPSIPTTPSPSTPPANSFAPSLPKTGASSNFSSKNGGNIPSSSNSLQQITNVSAPGDTSQSQGNAGNAMSWS